MVLSYTADFTVTWKDPQDGEKTWRHARDHFPRPIAPLGHWLIGGILPSPRSVFVNGYLYTTSSGPPAPPPTEIAERGGAAVWIEDYEPRCRAICAQIRDGNYEAMSAPELIDVLGGLVEDGKRLAQYTMAVLPDFRRPAFALVDFCEKELGAAGQVLSATLLQGFENGSAEAGAALERLAGLASQRPEVAQALTEERYDGLDSAAGGPEFLENLRTFLDEYGWRTETAGNVHLPTWAEDPSQASRLIGRYISDPGLSPAAAMRRAREQRNEAQKEVEAGLGSDKIEEFRRLLSESQRHVPINESRNHWQLTMIGSLRVPCLALGKKLVEAGVLATPNDVFFLYRDELPDAASRPSSLTKLVEERKEELRRWEALTPAPWVGAPPSVESATPDQLANVRHVRPVVGEEQKAVHDSALIQGIAASRGVARGPARIIHSLHESGRLQAGDILVTAMTAPPWTPLFAIAAAVVTDTGGLLSHSAICAREYAIPCVVGTGVATSRIEDGAPITVDGTTGVVILG